MYGRSARYAVLADRVAVKNLDSENERWAKPFIVKIYRHTKRTKYTKILLVVK